LELPRLVPEPYVDEAVYVLLFEGSETEFPNGVQVTIRFEPFPLVQLIEMVEVVCPVVITLPAAVVGA
jgi:hypothetical protein